MIVPKTIEEAWARYLRALVWASEVDLHWRWTRLMADPTGDGE